MPEVSVCEPAVRVSDLPRGLQPREKLLKAGERALSNTELMAIVLGSGTRAANVVKIADALMRKYGFEALPGLSLDEWRANKGIGRVRAIQLKAIFEMGRRAHSPRDEEKPVVSSPREAYQQLRDLRRARKEHLVALYVDAQNHLLARETISIGSLNTTRTHPREILQPAIACSALGFILGHNHPSGSLTPSQDDVDFTRAIKRASEIIGIGLYDHIIVAAGGFVSLKEKGLL